MELDVQKISTSLDENLGIPPGTFVVKKLHPKKPCLCPPLSGTSCGCEVPDAFPPLGPLNLRSSGSALACSKSRLKKGHEPGWVLVDRVVHASAT